MFASLQADVGQEEDFPAAEAKALKLGAKKVPVHFTAIVK